MEELNKAMELALIEFKKQNGEDAELEDGDWIVAEFNNATMFLSLNDGNLDIKLSPDKTLKVDCNIGLFCDKGDENDRE